MVITCKKPCKKKRSTMLTVEQMVDIALGTPEIGAVNFNVLHALLHVIIQQLNIQKYLVEFKGYDSDRMEGIILSAKPGPVIKLSEYLVDSGDVKPCKCKESKKDGEEEDKQKDKNLTTKKCECTGEKKKKLEEDEKEKTDKAKAESDTERKKIQEKTIIRELTEDECEDIEEPEPKKIRDYKPKSKSCPCKAGKEKISIVDEDVKATTSSYYGSDNEGTTCQTIVRIEPIGEKCDSWRSRPALAHESMVKLEEKVAMLQDAFEALEQMPSNDEIKKKSQNPGCVATPVKDLWQLYNLNKRVESCEGTIEKIASMIEDLVKETCNFKEAMMVIAGAVDEIECADQTARTTCCAALQGQTGNPFATSATEGQGANRAVVTFQKPEDTGGQPASSKCNGGPCFEENARNTLDATSNQNGENAQENGEGGGRNTSKLEDGMPDASPFNADTDGNGLPPPGMIGPEFYKMSANQKFCVLKNSIDCLTCQIKSLTDKLPVNQIAAKLCVLVSMQKQLDALEKEWRAFLETFGEEGVMGLHNTIDGMKMEFENINNSIHQLMTEKQEMEVIIKNILQDIENLKRVKADFEIMEDLLAEKADASVVNRKVSHDQFDAACDDLTRGLDETLDKLMQQEAMWNEAMEDLQKDLDNKLDKNEIMPLKEFINKKLKCLQEKLKQLAQLRKDAEAAGAKSRILRNLNCIACDGDVVMKMDNMINYQCPTLPPSRGLKPMLTYELDQVRKAMKKGPCRTMNHVEEVVMEAQKKLTGIPLTQREAVESKISKLAHFCNRYCGGSHTVTTPQQRVTRIGHFLTEFGPQAMAMFNQDNLDNKNPLCSSANVPPPEVDLQKPCV